MIFNFHTLYSNSIHRAVEILRIGVMNPAYSLLTATFDFLWQEWNALGASFWGLPNADSITNGSPMVDSLQANIWLEFELK